MSTAFPESEKATEPEQATGPGWPGEDHDRDALLSQDPGVTYQDGDPLPPAEAFIDQPVGGGLFG